MKLTVTTPCTYEKGNLSAVTWIRAGEGWDYHQGPMLHAFSDGRLFVCWNAYDIQECSNDGVTLYAVSTDNGQTWEGPQGFMSSPNAMVSHMHFAQIEGTDEAIMVYREGHYYGAREDRRRKAVTRWANYAESPMHLLMRRSHDCGFTWDPPTEIASAIVIGQDDAPYYGAPEQLLRLSNGSLLLLVGYMDAERRDPQHFNIAALHSSDGGSTWSKAGDFTVPEDRGAMEPSLVETGPGQLYGVIRNKSGFIYEIRASDSGKTWGEPTKTAIPTVESMAKLLKLAGGDILMAWNNQSSPSQQPRYPLAASLSADAGATWSSPKILANEIGLNQLSNFNMLQTEDGRILLCTSHYRAQSPACSDLDLLTFDQEWLSTP